MLTSKQITKLEGAFDIVCDVLEAHEDRNGPVDEVDIKLTAIKNLMNEIFDLETLFEDPHRHVRYSDGSLPCAYRADYPDAY